MPFYTLPPESEVKAELLRLRERPDVQVHIPALEAWLVFSQLQLALRHPMNTGPSAEVGRRVAEMLEAAIAPEGALAQLAQCGWDPQYDLPFAEGEVPTEGSPPADAPARSHGRFSIDAGLLEMLLQLPEGLEVVGIELPPPPVLSPRLSVVLHDRLGRFQPSVEPHALTPTCTFVTEEDGSRMLRWLRIDWPTGSLSFPPPDEEPPDGAA